MQARGILHLQNEEIGEALERMHAVFIQDSDEVQEAWKLHIHRVGCQFALH